MIYLIIKGDMDQALRAAYERHLSVEAINSNGHETIVRTNEDQWDAVRHWFFEDCHMPAPYAPGSLLFYHHKEDPT